MLDSGVRMHGCFMKRADTALTTPANGGSNTSLTATLIARSVDPLGRATKTTFQVDRTSLYSSPALQVSSQISSTGGKTASWATATLTNGAWSWRAITTASVGGQIGVSGNYTPSWTFQESGGAGVPRSLYLFYNGGARLEPAGVGANARSLYLINNAAVRNQMGLDIQPLARDLYLVVNKAYVAEVAARCLYLYEAKRDGEVFPYLNHISPTEQYIGGQVDLYGDGLGEYLDCTLEGTITVDSVNSSYVAANAVDRSTGSWVSNSNQSGAWIRFTFSGTKRITHIALESAGNGWGVPEFRFSDGLGNVSGGVSVPGGQNWAPEYPVGYTRALYALPTPRDTTYVEIRVSGGGGLTFIGLYEVWIYERKVPAENAEVSRAWLNLDLPSVKDLGIVTWQNRSPNWYPANSGVAPLPAATVTIPAGSTSGLVTVQEET